MLDVAEINGRATSAHQEARAALEKTVKNHCPFGCQHHDLDEYGYCHHLVGFTFDRRTYEPVNPLYRTAADGTPYNSGFKITSGSAPCQPGDVFVNPQRTQVDKGIAHLASEWVSDRVYRDRARPPVEQTQPPEPSELYKLQARKKELEKKLAEKRLREEILRLEAELGPSPATEEDTLRQELSAMEAELIAGDQTTCDECGQVCKSAKGLAMHKEIKHAAQGKE